MSAQTYLVRLKPHNRKRQYLVRNYTWRGHRFTSRWSEVSAAVADQLRELVQPHDPSERIPLFDVCTKAEALKLEEREAAAGTPATKVKDASPVADADLRDDKPKFNAATGKIERHVEPAEKVDNVKPIEATEITDDDADEVEPAPSLRGDKPARARAR